MKYRFTAEDFKSCRRANYEHDWFQDEAARVANALLEQWERESNNVYFQAGTTEEGMVVWTVSCSLVQDADDTHTAVLWNPQPIKNKE